MKLVLQGLKLDGKKITVVIDEKGKVTVDFQGFIGQSCFIEHSHIIEFLKSLGIDYKDVKVQVKPEAQLLSVETKKVEA